MSETFTKLFASITRSSIWLEDDQTLRVWVTMLALADRNGYVGASVGGLAAQARVPVEKTRQALEKFLAPDPDSRSKEFEGRRIEVTDRGWSILNYERFRDMRDEEARKEYERNRKRDQRAATLDGKTYVYFAEDLSTGLIKIGYSANPEVRVSAANLKESGAEGKVRLLAKFQGNKDLEKKYHFRFGAQWVRGEWFRNEGALAEFLSSPGHTGTKNQSPTESALSAQAEADPDLEEDRDRKNTPIAPSRGQRVARGWRRFPADFQPTPEHEALARELRVDLPYQLELIRDFEFSRPRTDPGATLRNWIRTAAERSRPARVGLQSNPSPADNVRRAFEKVDRLKAERAAREAGSSGAG